VTVRRHHVVADAEKVVKADVTVETVAEALTNVAEVEAIAV
jgi:hypothetical protein